MGLLYLELFWLEMVSRLYFLAHYVVSSVKLRVFLFDIPRL